MTTTVSPGYVPNTTSVRVAYSYVEGVEPDMAIERGDAFDRWYKAARDDARRQALLDYADLLDGPTYTMNYSSAEAYRSQLIALMRRDADILYGN